MINEINGPTPTTTRTNNNSERTDVVSADNQQTVPEQKSAPASSAGIELSSQAQLLSRLEAEISELPEIDQERVENIRNALNNGTFDIDNSSLAQNILDFEI